MGRGGGQPGKRGRRRAAGWGQAIGSNSGIFADCGAVAPIDSGVGAELLPRRMKHWWQR